MGYYILVAHASQNYLHNLQAELQRLHNNPKLIFCTDYEITEYSTNTTVSARKIPTPAKRPINYKYGAHKLQGAPRTMYRVLKIPC